MRAKHTFVLLGCLMLFFFLLPFVREGAWFSRALTEAAFVLVLVGGVHAASGSRRMRNIGLALLLPTIVLSGAEATEHHVLVAVLARVGGLATAGFVITVIGAHVLRQRQVTADTISAALSLYILLGMLWAVLYRICLELDPGSLGGGSAARTSGFDDVTYFSFVTLTTLGYGDLVPRAPFLRSLATLEALVGQVFLTVLVARLVGMSISLGPARPSARPPDAAAPPDPAA